MIGLEPGNLFAGRYEIIRSLGAGGMGAVYLACDPLERSFEVALKVLYPGAIESVQARQRFRNEITASYRVNHPNVVKAYEYFDAEDMQAYAMEYVDGGDLMDRMLGNSMSPDEAVSIIKQIASALSAVHAAGIVHRDLKPENILMTKRGEVKLSDFGVARLKDGQSLTQADSMVGTPKYLAPEYVETGECDNRGDIFALGVIAYEMICGHSPFGKNFKSDQLLDRLAVEIQPLDQAAPSCPPALARIIEKAMSVRLSKRYQNADAMLEDLEAFSRGDFTPRSSQALESPQNVETMEELHEEVEPITPSPKIEPRIRKPKQTVKPFQVPLWAPAALGILALILLVGVAGNWLLSGSGLLQLPEGQYKGVATDVIGTKSRYPFALIRRGENAWIMFGKRSCTMSPVTSVGEFSCGDLKFSLTPTSISGKNAVGSIRELSWGTEGLWNLESYETQPRAGITTEQLQIEHTPPRLEDLKGIVALEIGGDDIERARVLISSPTGLKVKEMEPQHPKLVAQVRSREIAGRVYQFQIQTKSGAIIESIEYIAEEIGARRDSDRIADLKNALDSNEKMIAALKSKINSMQNISDTALQARKDQELAKALILLREKENELERLKGGVR